MSSFLVFFVGNTKVMSQIRHSPDIHPLEALYHVRVVWPGAGGLVRHPSSALAPAGWDALAVRPRLRNKCRVPSAPSLANAGPRFVSADQVSQCNNDPLIILMLCYMLGHQLLLRSPNN